MTFQVSDTDLLDDLGGLVGLELEHQAERADQLRASGAAILGGDQPSESLGGPLMMYRVASVSGERGWESFLLMLALISVNLGLINLLPVPVLDGGHILIMALEGISRRDFSVQVKEKMLLAGFVVLMMLMVTVIYNDLTRISWIERLMPWRQ